MVVIDVNQKEETENRAVASLRNLDFICKKVTVYGPTFISQ